MKRVFKVTGMHCASCELVIEERLNKEKGVTKVFVDNKKGEVLIESEKIISKNRLNKIFRKNGYKFFEKEDYKRKETEKEHWWIPVIVIILIFLGLNKLGIGSFLKLNDKSSLLVFLGFGIIAGFSSCGALMSGIVLGHPKEMPKIIIGRILGYSILGAILGFFGEKIRINGLAATIFLVIVSIIMIIVALQQMEVKMAQKIRIGLPKKIAKKIINNKTAIILGLLTIFLPCGFTLLVESLVILRGNWVNGFLTMLVFGLGTNVSLFLMGRSGKKVLKNNKAVGAVILFFVLYNLSFQMGWLNRFYFKKIETKGETNQEEKVEIIRASYSRFLGVLPKPIIVKVGQRVRLEIEVRENEYGCMSTILLLGLFEKPQTLTKGKTITMEFTPMVVGDYQFVCAMGVPHKGGLSAVE